MRFLQCVGMMAFLMDKAGEGGSGGGGAGGGTGGEGGKGGEGGGQGGQGTGDLSKALEAITAQNKALMERLEKLEGKGKGGDDPDLLKKAELEREEKDKKNADSKALESALKFNLGAPAWMKENASLLPKDFEGIFAAAEKENYESQIQKSQAIKSSLIQSFFKIQENLDLLTSTQKSTLEDWLKLTKNGREEKAQSLFDNIFEPTLNMLKGIKKAQALNKGGERVSDDVESAYKERLMKGSRKHYMGEKSDA